MKKFNLNFGAVLMALLLTVTSIGITSCGDDTPDVVPGCTDVDGDQYNASATTDNGSCTYFDRFTGEWTGSFACSGILAALFTSADLSITESVSADNNLVSVLVLASTLPAPIPLTGIITKNDISIQQTLPNVEFTGLDIVPGIDGERFDITASGELTLQADGTLLGNIDFTLDEVAIPNDPVPDVNESCDYSATRK